MDVQHVPAALEQKLGAEATLALVGYVDRAGLMTAAADRFERRLIEETSGLRLQMAAMEGRLLEWSFLFWIGQVAVMTAIMTALLP